MAKKQAGGRTTAKGTQPATKSKGQAKTSGFTPPRAAPGRFDPGVNRPSGAPVNPMRSGHHRGNR